MNAELRVYNEETSSYFLEYVIIVYEIEYTDSIQHSKLELK